MKVSCCIPTVNHSHVLARALLSLLKQTVSPEHFEILVLDNGSNDNTRSVVETIVRDNPRYHIRYILEPEPGLLSGRHRGALEAKGELLVFLDDDIEASAGWLQAILQAFENSTVQLVGGPSLPNYEVEPPRWLESFWGTTPYGGRICSYLSLLDLGENTLEIHPNYIWGLNFAIRRRALFDLGGFHPDSVPDALLQFRGNGETGLTMQAFAQGFKAVFNPAAMVHHFVPASRMTANYFEHRAYLHGIEDSYSKIRREGELPGMKLSAFATSQFWCARWLVGRTMRQVKRVLETVEGTPSVAQTTRNVVADVEVVAIQRRVQRAYKAGYEFHRNAVRRSPELLAWVLRADYWNYSLPVLNE